MAQPSKKNHIVEVALCLFYKHGFNATGIEKIRAEAAISKKTLYNHFASKDDLILAVLRLRDVQFRRNFTRAVEHFGKTPAKRLEAVFDALEEWFNGKDFYGCMFINASGEFSDPCSPIHSISAEHKRRMYDYVMKLAKEAGAKNPQKLSQQLNLLMEGAIVQAHVSGYKLAARRAKEMAKLFINDALG
ncbi:MAG: TetR family transcriptional regulator [Alphaproteobacteria bacterium]|nr:MAG: TetR family transcriptional regulator [Alphaproteobacteria bacterium]